METITVGGPPGSGTSTLCNLLRSELDLRYIYAGQIFRDKARDMGMTLADFGKLCESDPSYDIALDEDMIEIAREGDVILEGRMIGPLCKRANIRSIRIYIDADRRIRADRLMVRDGGDIDTVISEMKIREESEARRYISYYDIDPRDKKWYDIVIDSSHMTPEEELDLIMDRIGKR